MCDTHLSFSARKSPAKINRITQAVVRSLRRDGHHVVVYLDDYFVCRPVFDSRKSTFDTLDILLLILGFLINWKTSWSMSMVRFSLGTDRYCKFLLHKLEKVQELLNLLDIYKQDRQASCNELESLASKLCWASHVASWGKPTSNLY